MTKARPTDDELIEQLRHACSVAFGDLLVKGMPETSSTGRLLLSALEAVENRTLRLDAELS